jgi:hypothetical protein
LDCLLKVVIALTFFLESIEEFVIHYIELIIVIDEYLCQIFQLKSPSSSWQDVLFKACILKALLHNRYLRLADIRLFEDDSLSDSFHAVLNEILEGVSILIHVEVPSMHLSNDELNVKRI